MGIFNEIKEEQDRLAEEERLAKERGDKEWMDAFVKQAAEDLKANREKMAEESIRQALMAEINGEEESGNS